MMDHSCEQARELMAAGWKDELDEMAATRLQMHLDDCEECSAEMAALGEVWQELGELPAPEPGPALRRRWEQTLGAFIVRQPARRAPWWQSFWPANPAWQMGLAAACLIAGLAGGALLQSGRTERDEVARLRDEVASTREMMAVSLLQQQSATERLRGVDYSARMPSMEPQVVSALIQAVNRDSNVNVRLAAIDALGKVATDSHVRESMTDSLTQQDSPMVQAALIDYLVDARARNAVGAIRDLVSRPDVNPTVRQRGSLALQHLTQQ